MKNPRNFVQKTEDDSRLWAFWIWNKYISQTELLPQLQSFIAKGFGGVAIRPCRDMFPLLLSAEFMSLFKKVLEVAKEHNFSIRFADDLSISWTNVFQNIIQQNIDFRAQRLTLDYHKIVTGKDIFEYHVENIDDYIFLIAKIKDETLNVDSVKDMPITVKDSTVTWKATPGEWQIIVFKKEWYLDPLGNFVPNLFNQKVAQAYVQNILEKFKAEFSRFIPSPFEGFVIELPSCLPADNSIPWDDDLITKYRSRYKKNILHVLPALFFEVSDCYARNRSHVYNFIHQAMYDRFPMVLENWAKKQQLSQWALSAERTINSAQNILSDTLAVSTAPLSSVGIQNQEGTEKNFAIAKAITDINTVEYGRQTIAVIGRNRKNISATLQSLKSEIDQHALFGASKIILDGCYFNIDHKSLIKTPFNPTWYHPEWERMEYLCNYTNHLLTFRKEVQHDRLIAVVMPSYSTMADYLPGNSSVYENGKNVFHKVVDELLSKNIEFDIVSEQYLLSCSVKPDGEFGTAANVRKNNYRIIIFPYARLINNSVFVLLEKIAAKKGTVIFINEAPQGNFDDGQNAAFTARVAKLTRSKNETVHIASLNDLIAKLTTVKRPVSVSIGGKPCTDIIATYGSTPHHDLYMFHNKTSRRDHFVTIRLPYSNNMYSVDCSTGECHELKNIHQEEGMVVFDYDFSPKETCVFFATQEKVSTASPKKDIDWVNVFATNSRNYRIVLKDRWKFKPLSFNAFPLANWNNRIGLSRDSGGFSHFYEAYFEVEDIPETCFLAFISMGSDGSFWQACDEEFEISVNGIVLKPVEDQAATGNADQKDNTYTLVKDLFGNAIVKFNILEAVMKGINRVSIRTVGLVDNPKTIMFPPLVIGTFSIKKGSRGWTMHSVQNIEVAYGSWTKHGFPYLSGCGEYNQIFEVPSEYERIALRFPQVSGSIAVEVNGKDRGVYYWQPMTVDVTDIVETRRNVIKVKVVNTIDNLLRMNNRVSGLLGEVFIDIY